MTVVENKKNPLLHREDLIISVESPTILSKDEMTKKISENLKKPEENIVVQNIHSKYGSNKLDVRAKIYDDIESKNKYETVSRKDRKKKLEEEKKAAEEKKKADEEAKAAAEKPAETTSEVKEEALSEEKVEEAPVEEKKEEKAVETSDEQITSDSKEEVKEEAKE